jgi:hypothetical protein
MHLSAGDQLLPAMRQIWISKARPPEILVVKEAPDPQPAAGEMRIRVEASGVNFANIRNGVSHHARRTARRSASITCSTTEPRTLKRSRGRSQADAGSSSSSTPSAGIHRRAHHLIQDRKNIGNLLLPP